MYFLQYNQTQFPFCMIVGDILQCHNLMLLHQQQVHEYDLVEPGKDQGTEFHKLFYDRCHDLFLPMYRTLVKEVGQRTFGEAIFLYQKIPTLRVQLPNNKAVGGVSHRDRDYHHPKKEINFLVPLTSMIGNNALFVESEDGLRDFRIVELHPGQILCFNGVNLEHGNLPNTMGWTRVSFDFRLMLESDAHELSNKLSVAHGLQFTEGEYYASSRGL